MYLHSNEHAMDILNIKSAKWERIMQEIISLYIAIIQNIGD